MKIKMFGVISLFTLFSWSAMAENLNFAFGASVPTESNLQNKSQPFGPSRSNGGEHFVLKFASLRTVTSIRLTSFSAARTGKNLVRAVTAQAGATTVALPGLVQFNKVTVGNPTNYDGNVMLTDSSFVEVTPNQGFSQVDFQIEGFSNDDTSILIQIVTAEAVPETQFILTRTGEHSDLTFGQMISEAGFAKFNADNLKSLMTQGTIPQAGDVAGKSFVCSSYSKLDKAQVDFKSRAYVLNGSALVSHSDLEVPDLTWEAKATGLLALISKRNGCGNFTSYHLVRLTPAGNLIAEVSVDLNAYVQLCVSAGYDEAGTRAVELNSTFPSVVSPTLVVDAYEFCHLAN